MYMIIYQKESLWLSSEKAYSAFCLQCLAESDAMLDHPHIQKVSTRLGVMSLTCGGKKSVRY